MLKVLVIATAALEAAIASVKVSGRVNASECLIAQAAKQSFPTPITVKDCGSFYIDTSAGNFELPGGYDSPQAKDLRRLMTAFGNHDYDTVRKVLPYTVVQLKH